FISKFFYLRKSEIVLLFVHPASTGGAFRDRHGRRKRAAMDARVFNAHARGRRDLRGRPSRVVPAPRRWCQACGRSRERWWLTSPVPQGEHGAAVKTIMRGMSDVFG